MEKSELLQNLKLEYEHLTNIVKAVQVKGMENEIIDKKWVLKDVVSHLSFYEREAIKVLQKKSIENNPFYTRTDDDRNEENFNETHNKSLQEIQESANKIFKDLHDETAKLTQEELDSKFPGMNRTVSQFIIGESYGHYPDHINKLQKRFNV